jgi:hypothetical protein
MKPFSSKTLHRNRTTRSLWQSLVWLLIVPLAGGCATHPVDFTSTPAGATVQIGAASCLTPCTLKVPCGERQGRVSFATTAQEVDLPACGPLRDFGERLLAGTEVTLQGVSATCLLAGIVGLQTMNEEVENGDDFTPEIGWFTLASFVAAGIFAVSSLGVGKLKEASRHRVAVDLPPVAEIAPPPVAPAPAQIPNVPSNLRLDASDLQRLFPARPAPP